MTNIPYYRQEDIVADFLDECCVIDEKLKVKVIDIYDLFLRWYVKNVSKKGMLHKRFGKILETRFKKRRSHGIFVYYGVGILPADLKDINQWPNLQ